MALKIQPDSYSFPVDPKIPLTEHPGLAARMFGSFIQPGADVLNVGAGKTDLGESLQRLGIIADVTSVDPSYGQELDGTEEPKRVPGIAEDLPFEDERFDVVIAHFLMQHLSAESRRRALEDMVRVTRTAAPTNMDTGLIFINPVFKERYLVKELGLAGLGDFTQVFDSSRDGVEVAHKRAMFPTLVVQKTPELDLRKVALLASVIEETSALVARRTPSELVVRLRGGLSTR